MGGSSELMRKKRVEGRSEMNGRRWVNGNNTQSKMPTVRSVSVTSNIPGAQLFSSLM